MNTLVTSCNSLSTVGKPTIVGRGAQQPASELRPMVPGTYHPVDLPSHCIYVQWCKHQVTIEFVLRCRIVLDIIELSWMIHTVIVAWKTWTVPKEWQAGLPLSYSVKSRGWKWSVTRVLHCTASPESVILQCWKGGCHWLWNLRFTTDSAQPVKQLNNCLSVQSWLRCPLFWHQINPSHWPSSKSCLNTHLPKCCCQWKPCWHTFYKVKQIVSRCL